MKIRLGDLEEIRANPRQFARRDAPVFSGMSTFRALQYGAFEYHKQNDDLAAAAMYLEDLYNANFVRPARLLELQDQLEQYDDAYRALGNIAIRWRLRVSVEAGEELSFTGEIPRLDMNIHHGFSVWYFAKSAFLWEQELRMPILQGHVAELMGTETENITVGYYFFDSGQYDSRLFTRGEVDNAFSEALEVVHAMLRERG